MPSRNGPETGDVVRARTNDAASSRWGADEAWSDCPQSQLEAQTAEALRLYRARLSEVDRAEAALKKALKARHGPDRLATARRAHSAAQTRLDAARDRYITLEAQLGFVAKV